MKVFAATLVTLASLLVGVNANADELRIGYDDLLTCHVSEHVCVFAAAGRAGVLFPPGQQFIITHTAEDSTLPGVLLTPTVQKRDLTRLLSPQLIAAQEPDVRCAQISALETCYEADGERQVLIIFSDKVVGWETVEGFMGRIPFALSVPELPAQEVVSQ